MFAENNFVTIKLKKIMFVKRKKTHSFKCKKIKDIEHHIKVSLRGITS